MSKTPSETLAGHMTDFIIDFMQHIAKCESCSDIYLQILAHMANGTKPLHPVSRIYEKIREKENQH